jgi:hypothetical protein
MLHFEQFTLETNPDRSQELEIDRVLDRFESMVEAVLAKPPPAPQTGDPDWRRLLRFCETYRDPLARRIRHSKRNKSPQMADVWLRQLASPPYGPWNGVRNGLTRFIACCGLTPRRKGEPLFSPRPLSRLPSQRHDSPSSEFTFQAVHQKHL